MVIEIHDLCLFRDFALPVMLNYAGKGVMVICENAKGYFAKRRAKRSVIGRSGDEYFADYLSLLWSQQQVP